MRFANVDANDFINGEGISVSFWTQGCPFRCKGCFNQETWNYWGGHIIDKQELIADILDKIPANGVMRNFSVLGGEPLGRNYFDTLDIIKAVRFNFPYIKIYVWTGFGFDKVIQNFVELLDYIDTIITEPFILEQRDLMLELRGSRNQEIWYKKNSLWFKKNE